jgi:lysophospholipase L1-like esterase
MMNQAAAPHRSRREIMIAAAAGLVLPLGPAHGTRPMKHVALLGDSVFDNGAYVGGGPDVVTQLRQLLPAGWRATLAAVDGGVIRDIPHQLERVPDDATHLVISVGGNDALGFSSVLGAPSRSVADTLEQLVLIRGEFARNYARMIEAVRHRGLPTAICTIYDPRYPDAVQRRVGATALCVINDAIIREAARAGVPIIDLRLVCDEDGDFANPIEPSSQGGWKIAGAIVALVTQHDFGRARSEIFTD